MREELVELTSRSGVSQRFAFIEPEDRRAAAVLFAGGPGLLGLAAAQDGVSSRRDINFLVRSRWLFARAGMAVAVVDAPSDRQDASGMLGGFRNSAEHLDDIDAVVAWLADRTSVPVWLVGTSRGTESVAYAAIHRAANLGGIVLTSSVTVTTQDGTSILDLPLEKIEIPAFVAAHVEDACDITRRMTQNCWCSAKAGHEASNWRSSRAAFRRNRPHAIPCANTASSGSKMKSSGKSPRSYFDKDVHDCLVAACQGDIRSPIAAPTSKADAKCTRSVAGPIIHAS